ncbi:MAG: hypothetical protein ACYSW2_17505, partial [Planctomycetota bacterium]
MTFVGTGEGTSRRQPRPASSPTIQPKSRETPQPLPLEAVEQLLLQVVAEAALGLGHEHVEGHGRHLVTQQLVAVEQGAHLRPVA